MLMASVMSAMPVMPKMLAMLTALLVLLTALLSLLLLRTPSTYRRRRYPRTGSSEISTIAGKIGDSWVGTE